MGCTVTMGREEESSIEEDIKSGKEDYRERN